MANHVLLLGAGFSKNWGGLLAKEIMEHLYGRLQNCDHVSRLLRKSGNFENALSMVQLEHKNSRSLESATDLEILQNAISDVFDDMNSMFASLTSIEVSNQVLFSIQKFLSQFDAIFTLNQDLLLELHYNIEIYGHPRWSGHSFPGMKPPANWSNLLIWERIESVWVPSEERRIGRGSQPIFKLHGSANWRDSDGGQLMVMGANKRGAIREMEILDWYAAQFSDYLTRPDSRLMIVGYSFLDQHINDAIYEAWESAQTGIFIVDCTPSAPMGQIVFWFKREFLFILT